MLNSLLLLLLLCWVILSSLNANASKLLLKSYWLSETLILWNETTVNRRTCRSDTLFCAIVVVIKNWIWLLSQCWSSTVNVDKLWWILISYVWVTVPSEKPTLRHRHWANVSCLWLQIPAEPNWQLVMKNVFCLCQNYYLTYHLLRLNLLSMVQLFCIWNCCWR